MSKNYIVTCIQFMLVAVRALLGYPKGRRNVIFIGGEIITKVLQGWWNLGPKRGLQPSFHRRRTTRIIEYWARLCLLHSAGPVLVRS